MTPQAMLNEALSSLTVRDEFAFDLETTSLDPFKSKILIVSVATEDGAWALSFEGPNALPYLETMEKLEVIFSDPDKIAITWNGGFDVKHLIVHGVNYHNKIADGMVGCIAAGSDVLLGDGSWKKIETLKDDTSVAGFLDGQIREFRAHSWKTGRRECVRVTFKSGRELILTPEHLVMQWDGWHEASTLSSGDRVMVAATRPSQGCSDITNMEARLIGYAIGDGCTKGGTFRIGTNDPGVHQDLHTIATSFGDQLSVFERRKNGFVVLGFVGHHGKTGHKRDAKPPSPIKNNGKKWAFVDDALLRSSYGLASIASTAERLGRSYEATVRHASDLGISDSNRKSAAMKFLSRYGMSGKGCFEKRIPDAVFMADLNIVHEVLAGLWITDGYITGDERHARVGYTTSNKALAKDVQRLLAMCGLSFTITNRGVRKGGTIDGRLVKPTAPAYEVQSKRRASLAYFKAHIRLVGRRAQKLASVANATLANLVDRTLPVEVWQTIEAERSRAGVTLEHIGRSLGYSSSSLSSMRRAAVNNHHGVSKEKVIQIADAMGFKQLRARCDEPVHWDTVKSIEPAGEHDVYDLSVTEAHNFVVDGLVVHNSWLCDETLAQRKMLGLKKQTLIHYQYEMTEIKDTNILDGIVDEEAEAYARDDALYTYKHWKERIEPDLRKQGLEKTYWKISAPVIRVLADMELNGFFLDTDHLTELEGRLGAEVEELTNKIKAISGVDTFNPGSGKQLSKLLFDDLGIEIKRGHPWTKSGYWGTAEDVLKRYRGAHTTAAGDDPIELILRLRWGAKLLKTYIKPFLKRIDEGHDGRIRTNFGQTRTKTGRLASSDPNLQNIPTEKNMIRRAFIAPPGKRLIVADYSQIEMRVGGFLAAKRLGQSNIQTAYAQSKDADLHEATRQQMESLGVERFYHTDPNCRRNAKCVTGDTRVLTSMGWAEIGNLVTHRDPDTLVSSVGIKVVSDNDVLDVTKVYCGGVHPVFELVTRHGLSLRCTANHRFVVVKNGQIARVPLSDLSVGSSVLMKVGMRAFGADTTLEHISLGGKTSYQKWRPPRNLTEPVCRALGYLFAEGGLHAGPPSYAVTAGIGGNEQEYIDDFRLCWEALFGERASVGVYDNCISFRCCSKDAVEWLLTEGLGASAGEKQVPRCILAAPEWAQVEFLRAAFAGDGSASRANRTVRITLKSERGVRDIQLMLLNMGIVSTIYEDTRESYGPYWTLAVCGLEALRFNQQIGFSLSRKEAALCESLESRGSWRSTRFLDGVTQSLIKIRSRLSGLAGDKVTECLTHGIKLGNTRFDLLADEELDETLLYLRKCGLWSDEIVSISPAGEHEVFDVVEPTKKLFVTNGLLTEDTVNFGFFYGRSAAAFSREHGIDIDESKDIRNKFLYELYPEIPKMQKYCAGQISMCGFVKTITGRRRRFLEDVGKSVEDIWWPAWMAWNSLCQGCQPPDGLILTNRGYVPIGELVPEKHALITEHGILKSYVVHKVGKKSGYHIETTGGWGTFSAAHRFGVYHDGTEKYIQLKDLGRGSWIMGAPSIIIEGDEANRKCSDDEAYLLGVLIGDGSYSAKKNQVSLSAGGSEVDYTAKLSEMILSVWGVKVKWSRSKGSLGYAVRTCINRKALRERLLSLGLEKVVGKSKTVPNWVFNAPVSTRRSFLQGLMDTDGGFSGPQVTFTSVSRALASGVWRLLESLGVAARYRECGHAVRIFIEQDNISRFRDNVGFRMARKAARLDCAKDSRGYLPPNLVAEIGEFILNQEETRKLGPVSVSTGNAHWERTTMVMRRLLYDNNEFHLLHRLRKGSGSKSSCIAMLRKLSSSPERDRLVNLCSRRWAKITKYEPSSPVEMMDIESLEENKTYIGAGVLQHNSAQDIIQIAMRNIYEGLVKNRRDGLEFKGTFIPPDIWKAVLMLVQVHDELVAEAPEEYADLVGSWIEHMMSTAVVTPIMLFPAEVGVGHDWEGSKC